MAPLAPKQREIFSFQAQDVLMISHPYSPEKKPSYGEGLQNPSIDLGLGDKDRSLLPSVNTVMYRGEKPQVNRRRNKVISESDSNSCAKTNSYGCQGRSETEHSRNA